MLCAQAQDPDKVDMEQVLSEQRSEFQRLSAELRDEMKQLLDQQTLTILESVKALSFADAPTYSTNTAKAAASAGLQAVGASDSQSVSSNAACSNSEADFSPRGSKSVWRRAGDACKDQVALQDLQPPRTATDVAAKFAKWEWQRTSGDWAPYPDSESKRIERQFHRGKSMCHVKSGKEGKTTMEVFFVDMIQLDPASGNVRRIRRNGSRALLFRREPLVWVHRNFSALFQEFITGEIALESFKSHYDRKKSFTDVRDSEMHTMRSSQNRPEPDSHRMAEISMYKAPLSSTCGMLMHQITEHGAFVAMSICVTLLQVAWVVGTMQDLESENRDLYARGAVHIVVEHVFCMFFSVELAMRYVGLERALDGIRDGWFLFDSVLVCLSILEVLVLPPLRHFQVIDSTTANNQIFRIFRLSRIFRFFRVLRRFRDLQVVVKGAMVGMRAAAYVWALLGLLIFTFGLILFISVQDADIKSEYFATFGDSMQTLFLTGIMLDGIRTLFGRLVEAGEGVALFAFSTFQFFSFFGLLNMLIGAFCNSAMEVAAEEQKTHDLRYIKQHLMEILDCYLDDGQSAIDKKEFELIMQNREIDNTLRQCGTDVDALRSIKDTLFQEEREELTLRQLFEVIMSLRANTPACASHIVSLTTLMEQRFDLLQQVLTTRRRKPVVEMNPSSVGSS